MRSTSFVLISSSIIAVAGCGEQHANLGTKPQPSGGAMIRLPDDRGFVAINTEAPDMARKAKTKNRMTSIVAYFYQNDGTTAMNPPPTEVVFELYATSNAKTVALSSDASDPNRFVSTPGPYSNALQGTVRAKIGGVEVRESFSAL